MKTALSKSGGSNTAYPPPYHDPPMLEGALARPRKTEAVADEVTAVLDGVERMSIRVLGLIVEHVRLLCVRKCLLVQACQVFVGNRLPRH